MNCHVCKTSVQVSCCNRCLTPVCAAHAGFAYRDEYQYDKESWVCFTSCRGLALTPYDPRFHVFDWTTVADNEQVALVNELKNLKYVSAAHLEVLREAKKLLAA